MTAGNGGGAGDTVAAPVASLGEYLHLVAGPARRAAHELALPPGAPVSSCVPAVLQAWTSELANSAAFVYTKAWLAALRKKLEVRLIFKAL